MPPPKNYVKIQYPRKCLHCDYSANNPQMWHYHVRTHAPISSEQLCDLGCGKPALFRGTGGKYTCMKNWAECTSYISRHSRKVTKQWENNTERRKKLGINNPMKNGATKLKQAKLQSITKKQKQIDAGISDEIKQDFARYSRLIRRRGAVARKKWAKEQGYIIGLNTYHIDHKFSVYDSWKAGLSDQIVNHPMNLRIVEANENLKKGSKSSITLDELLESIKAFSEQG